jgi:hypothetical protein
MGRRRPAPTTPDSRQFDLTGSWYEPPPAPRLTPGSLACGPRICGILTEAISASGRTRAEIAFRMSEFTGDAISEFMLNSWTAKSHDRHRFPLEYAAAFEAATDSFVLQQLVAELRGTRVMVAAEVIDAELGRVHRQIAELQGKARKLKTMSKGGTR